MIKNLLLISLAFANTTQAVSFLEYYFGNDTAKPAHWADVDGGILRDGKCNLANIGLTDLVGFDAEHLRHFDDITGLFLNGNKLTTLPDSIATMPKLQILDLTENEFRSLPDVVYTLSDLHKLSLVSVGLQELSEDIGNMIGLRNLNLSRNNLLTLPETIGKLGNLVSLSAKDNQISQLPDLSGLTSLKLLFLDNNQLSDLPPGLDKLPRLDMLRLVNNPIPLTNEQLQKVLGHAHKPKFELFKTPEQQGAELVLFEAIVAGNEAQVKDMYHRIMTGRARAPEGITIDVSKIRYPERNNPKGINLLHLVIQTAFSKISPIRSQMKKIEIDTALSKEQKNKELAPLVERTTKIDQTYTNIFGTLIQFGGPKVEEMLLARDKKGDDVIQHAVGALGADSILVKTLLAKPRLKPFRMKQRPLITEEVEKVKEVKEEKAKVSPEEVEKEKKRKIQEKRLQALEVLGLEPFEDQPHLIEGKYLLLRKENNPTNFPAGSAEWVQAEERFKALYCAYTSLKADVE